VSRLVEACPDLSKSSCQILSPFLYNSIVRWRLEELLLVPLFLEEPACVPCYLALRTGIQIKYQAERREDDAERGEHVQTGASSGKEVPPVIGLKYSLDGLPFCPREVQHQIYRAANKSRDYRPRKGFATDWNVTASISGPQKSSALPSTLLLRAQRRARVPTLRNPRATRNAL
jgi:hypothetical protein